jgi:hypothetical protein
MPDEMVIDGEVIALDGGKLFRRRPARDDAVGMISEPALCRTIKKKCLDTS